MHYRTRDLFQCTVRARDDSLGPVRDLLFDDRDWTTRYLVVDTGKWFGGKQVLLPPSKLVTVDLERNEVGIDMKRKEVEDSPGVQADPPLSMETRMSYYDDWIWTSYGWGGFAGLPRVKPGETPERASDPPDSGERNHLRSVREITDYRIEARDGGIGHVEEFLVRGDGLRLDYVIVDTRNWLPGKKVAVPPKDFSEVDWKDRRAHVDLTRDAVKQSPEVDELEEHAEGSGVRLARG